MSSACVVGVIGGSGIYDIEGLENAQWVKVETPFGSPSDELLTGDFQGQKVVFLPRHGRGHRIPPSELNFRANIYALKSLGVTHIISLSAVGSLREGLTPGTFVLVDQFIDRTFARQKSFFSTGLVAHVSMADPVCHVLGNAIAMGAASAEIHLVRGGTYMVMEGPQFSTKAESNLYRQWGCDVIGMTNMPEAKLAREAEIAFSTVAMITDFDCWHADHDAVTVDAVIKVLVANADRARALVKATIPLIKDLPPSPAHTALDHAIITPPASRDADMVEKLKVVAGRVL